MLRLQYSEAPKAATTKVKLSKEGIRRRLDDDVKMAKKVFWQIVRRLCGERSQSAFFIEASNGATLKDQDAI